MSGAKNYKSKHQIEQERKRQIAIEEEKKRIKQVLEQNRLLALEKERLKKIQLAKEKSERENFLKDIHEDVRIRTTPIISKESDYLEKIILALDDLKAYDEELYELKKIQFNQLKNTASQKAKLFLADVRLHYEKVKSSHIWTQIYRESIEELFKQLNTTYISNQSLKQDIENILQFKTINENTYDNIFERIQNELQIQKEKMIIATQLISSLNSLNYLVISDNETLVSKLMNKEKIILPVSNQSYQIAVAINKDNSILTRFVKTVHNQKDIENISTSDRLHDNENLKKWCSLQATLQENMKHAGIDTIQEVVEDEESDILYIVDSSPNTHHAYQINKEKREQVNG